MTNIILSHAKHHTQTPLGIECNYAHLI